MFSWVNLFDLFLLDFDGLLVNTEKLHFLAYKEMVESLGFCFPIDYSTYCQGAHISQEALKNLIYSSCSGLQEAFPDWMSIRSIKQKKYLSFIKDGKVELMPGIFELLTSLDYFNKKSCIVTNSPREQIELVKLKLPILQKIPYIVSREDYKEAKPSGECYEKARHKYAAPNDKIIGFEDSTKGVMALNAANIYSVEISQTTDVTLAKKKFSSFLEISSEAFLY